MIFHLFLNSLIVFCVLAFFVELTIFVFQIREARIRYWCRSLPILKLPFDLLFFIFFDEGLITNLNPFSCQVFTYEFITSLFPVVHQAGDHIIIPAYIASYIHPTLFNFIVGAITVIAIGAIARKIILFALSRSYLNKVFRSSQPCYREIQNDQLSFALKQSKTVLLTSTEVDIPFAADHRYIFLPEVLMQELCQDEYESVVAHELEHLRWRDPAFKLINSLACALFWWVPTDWLMKRLEGDQEQASDSSILKYGLHANALAGALMKVIKRAKYLKCPIAAVCPLDSPKVSHVDRLEALLNLKNGGSRIKKVVSLLGMVVAIFVCLCFWIC